MKSVLRKSLALYAAALMFGACDTMNDAEDSAAAKYALTLSTNGTELTEYTFPAVYPSYEEVDGLEVTLTNAGPGSAEGIVISLSGEGSGAFSLTPDVIERLPAGSTAPFTLRPVTGLAGGEYLATVTVTTPTGTTQFDVTFTVSTTPLYGIALDVTEHTFTPASIDYPALDPLTVTITNIGNEATGELTIAPAGEQAGSFQVSPESIANIEAGGTETFTVQPVSGLAEGTYTATVTVGGGNDITANLDVSFRVFANLIEITTAEQLAEIGDELPSDGSYILMDNLVLEDWTPVTNTKTAPFTGTFLGNEKKITIDSFDPDVLNTDPDLRLVGYIGVFGYIQSGRVENLTVNLNMPDEQQISNATPGLGKAQYIGAVAGYAEDTVFENITVLGDINLSKPDGGDIFLAGISGYLKGGSITTSTGAANLTAQEPYPAGNGPAYAAGLAGRIDLAEIRESSVSGAIRAYSNRGTAYVGGATGYTRSSSLYKITVSATINGEASKNFAGIATFGNRIYAGGVTGFIGGPDRSSEIRQCAVTGNVTGTSYAPIAGENTIFVGGIAGMTGVSGQPVLITDSYSRGNVTAMTAPVFSGTNATLFAGGIVGQVSLATVQNCYATGIITANSITAEGNWTHAGGIVAVMQGQADSTITIQNCAALSPQINWRLYTKDNMILKRIAIRGVYDNMTSYWGEKTGQERYPENTTLANNIAYADMVLNYEPSAQQAAKVPPPIVPVPGYDTEDGEDCDAQPVQEVYEKLGWDFTTVWKIASDGYPAFQWQK